MGPFDLGSSTTESDVSAQFPISGTLSRLEVFAQASPGGGNSWVLTLRVNGVNSSVTCTITGTATRCSDLANSVAITANQTLSVEVSPTSNPSAKPLQWRALVTP